VLVNVTHELQKWTVNVAASQGQGLQQACVSDTKKDKTRMLKKRIVKLNEGAGK
jgi:hypothetical protein